jgi:serine/threonine-protein phosphatase 2A regulatory subunit A
MSLGRMVDAVGGPLHAHVLLRPLELLLTVEENSVRDVAAASAQVIADVLPAEAFVTHYASHMLARLACKEWFTARISAASLIAAAYPKMVHAPAVQQQHLQYFAQLCQDDTPMVRRVAAQYLGVMLKNVVEVNGRRAVLGEDGPVATILIPLYEQFASNEQPDSVRLQTTENCVAFGQVMSNIVKEHGGPLEDVELALLQRILPLVVATIDDRSWRVRWTAAAKFANVIAAYDELPDVMDALVPAYEKLLQDPEAEVRTAATFNLARVAQCKALVPMPLSSQSSHTQNNNNNSRSTSSSSQQQQQQQLLDGIDNESGGPRVSVAERLVKRVTSLTEDDSEHVRAALAMVATELAPILGKDATITHLVPPVLLLLRDAASEVRLNLISSLSALNEVIGVDLLSQSLLPAILDLAQDGKWRIRLAIIQHIPLLAKQLGKDFFTEKLASMCVGWLGDDIASIRIAAAGNLKQLTGVFGTEWAMTFLIPSIDEIRRHESYLRRLTALQAFSLMSTEMDADTARLHVLPLVLEMTTDPVANIRFNVAKELQNMIPACGPGAYESQALPVLNMLLDDDDRDVRYYAEQSLHALSRYVKSISKG